MTQPKVKGKLWLCLVALAGILVLAFLLRSGGLSWGLPDDRHYFSYHPDEIFLVLPPLSYFAQGDWNPHFFNYGTLYIYLVGIPALVLNVVPGVTRFPDHLRPLYELGRNVTLWMALATIALLSLASSRGNPWAGLLAALFLATCPLHLVNSAYATVDVPATLCLTLAFVLTVAGNGETGPRRGLAAGMAVGLAAATKYNAGLFVVPLVLAPLLRADRRWCWSWLAACVGGAALGFVIGCPFFWTEEFRRDLEFEIRHARVGGTLAFVGTGNGWWYHLSRGLPTGLGYPLLAAVAVGVVASLRRGSLSARLSLVWLVFYLLAIGFGRERFIRYLVPLTPFLCLLAAEGIMCLREAKPRRLMRPAAALSGGLVIGLTAAYAFGYLPRFMGADPRSAALTGRDIIAWFVPNPRIGLVEAPWFSDPPVAPHNAGAFSRPMFETWNRQNGDRIIVTGWDAHRLRAEKPDLFFLSDLESQDLIRLGDAKALEFADALGEVYRDHRVFARAQSPFSWLAPPRRYAPPDWLYQSPRITMYYNPR